MGNHIKLAFSASLLFLSHSITAQIANRLIVTQNYLQNVNPANVVFTVPPNDNRFWVANRDALVFNFNQVTGIKDTVLSMGDARYKGISWIPSWPSDILGVPSVFPTNIANVSGLSAALAGKQPVGAYITSVSSSDVITALGYTPYNSSNPAGYISSISGADVSTALGYTPYNASNPNSYISRTGISAGTGLSYNSSTGVFTNTSPDQTISLTSGDGISVAGSYPTFVISSTQPVINSNVSRALNSIFTISSSRESMVYYTVTISVTNPLLAGSSTGNAFLEYSSDGGSTWIIVSQAVNTSTVGLAVTIAITNVQTSIVSGVIPANSSVRIRTTTSGTASVTYVRGQEIIL